MLLAKGLYMRSKWYISHDITILRGNHTFWTLIRSTKHVFFFFKFLTFHLKCIAHQSLVQTFLQFIHVYSFCSLWLEESQYHLQYLKNSVCNSLQLHLHKGLICFPFSLQFQKRKFQEYFTCFDDYLQVGTTCGIQNKHTNE